MKPEETGVSDGFKRESLFYLFIFSTKLTAGSSRRRAVNRGEKNWIHVFHESNDFERGGSLSCCSAVALYEWDMLSPH